jgi:hypothetical protein
VARESTEAATADLASLVKGVVDDCGKLLAEHVDLMKSELRRELGRAGGAAVRAGAGAGLVAAGGLFAALAAAHGLHRATRLPLWGCYGLVAGSLGVAGAGLLAAARAQARALPFPALPQTAGALKEDAAWLSGRRGA